MSKDSHCKIGKIRLKNGCEVLSFPQNRRNFRRVCFGWGEVTLRAYDDKILTIADINYMCDAAKHINMTGDE